MMAAKPLQQLLFSVEYSDSTETRFWLALGGWIWFLSFAWPGRLFTSEGFAWLGTIANETTWMISWLIYASMKTWRLWSRRARPIITLGLNSFGCFLFSTSAIATSIAIFPTPPVWPANCVLALMSCWILFKTAYPHEF